MCRLTKIMNTFLLKRHSKNRNLLIISVKLQCSMIDTSLFSFSEHSIVSELSKNQANVSMAYNILSITDTIQNQTSGKINAIQTLILRI